MHNAVMPRRLGGIALVLLLLLTLGVCFCSGCARDPMRVTVRRVSDGHRVAVAFGEAIYSYQTSDNSDHWLEMIADGPDGKAVPFTDFVFLVDIDFPMEAGASEDSVLISFDQFYGQVDAVVKVYAVGEYAPTANATVWWQITEVPIEIEIPREGRIVVAPTGGEFPQNSRIVLALDIGSGVMEDSTPPMLYRGGYFARVYTDAG